MTVLHMICFMWGIEVELFMVHGDDFFNGKSKTIVYFTGGKPKEENAPAP